MTAPQADPAKPKLAVWKFASCDGCQLTLLSCEDELLALADAFSIAHFPEASRAAVEGPYDLSLVEGSISTRAQRAKIAEVRAQSRHLVTIGACATAGGVQALRNGRDLGAIKAAAYPDPDLIDSLADSTPIADHVAVDFELRGCPIDKRQLLEVIGAFLAGRRPDIPRESLCVDCKRRGIACVAVTGAVACMGPVTQTGCGALCPAHGRGCYGCFGPMETPNTAQLARSWRRYGLDDRSIADAFRSVTAGAPAFAEEAARHD